MSPRPGPTPRYFVSQRLRLHYAEWGDADAPPLLLVHGGRDHCRAWDTVAAALQDRYRVIAPDLRGHGDSAWSTDGHYATLAYLADLAQLVAVQRLGPVPIIAHSLGAHIASRYAAVYPEQVACLIAIEGISQSPTRLAEREAVQLAERTRLWLAAQRQRATRPHRRYPTLADAQARMQAANRHLSPAQARHLTGHGMLQNEDGSWSWKFDPYVRSFSLPEETTLAELEALWAGTTCPTLLVHGGASWASNPALDGRARHFPDASVLSIPGAGHWVHHDAPEAFMAAVQAFLAAHAPASRPA